MLELVFLACALAVDAAAAAAGIGATERGLRPVLVGAALFGVFQAGMSALVGLVGLVGLVALAVATSIDALAAGISLPLLEVRAAISILTIGVVTAVLSLLGGCLGSSLGGRFGSRLEIGGGLVLVALGLKILVEHLVRGT